MIFLCELIELKNSFVKVILEKNIKIKLIYFLTKESIRANPNPNPYPYQSSNFNPSVSFSYLSSNINPNISFSYQRF